MARSRPNQVKSGALAAMIRNAGHTAKSIAENMAGQGDLSVTGLDGRNTKVFNVLSYIEAPWGLQMRLYPVQRVIVKLFYNIPLDEKLPAEERLRIRISDMFNTKTLYTFTEREFLSYLFNEGRINIKEQDHMRRQLILSIGRRGGKTTLSAVFASYELYRILSLSNPQAYYGLPNGNRIQIISVATDKDQASLLFNDVTSHVAKCEFFQPYIANNTQSYVKFRTPFDIERFGPTVRHDNGKFQSFNGKASVQLTFKASVSKGLRGSGNIVIILDEMAHFQDKGVSSAKDIYDAITPSTAAFSPKDPRDNTRPLGPTEARIICISSPLNKAGKFYELFQQAMSLAPGTENMIAIQAPTWEINPTVDSTYYRNKYHEDPAVFMTEHGALFTDRVRGWIERESDLLDCIRPALRPKLSGPPRFPHQMGIDVGLIGDGTTVAITHLEGPNIVLDYHEVWYAGMTWKDANPHLPYPIMDYAKALEGVERLDFEEITKWIVALSKKFYITDGLFDRWNGLPLEQALKKAGLKQFRSDFFNRDASSRMYQAVKLFMFDKRLVLYDWPLLNEGEGKVKHSPLIEELLSLQAKQTSKNQIIVEAPKIGGAHDDMSDAFVRAVWLSMERLTNQKITWPHGAPGQERPRGPASLHQYQRARARQHGVTDRMPRSPVRR